MKRIYDYFGRFTKSVDENGSICDRNGNLNGSVSNDRLYDYYGNHSGTRDGDTLYDRNGNVSGSIDRSGGIYDYYGCYIGRFEDDDD